MNIADKVDLGSTVELLKGKETWTIKIVGFVDDKRHYTNNLSQHMIEPFIKVTE